MGRGCRAVELELRGDVLEQCVDYSLCRPVRLRHLPYYLPGSLGISRNLTSTLQHPISYPASCFLSFLHHYAL